MTQFRVSIDGQANVDGQTFADGELVADSPVAIASDGPVAATVEAIDPDPPDGPASALAALLDAGLTLPQAVDYWAVEHWGGPKPSGPTRAASDNRPSPSTASRQTPRWTGSVAGAPRERTRAVWNSFLGGFGSL